ncbi:Metallo-dependent phosphatase-like protein [Chytridium lagenaria]|nr:Metallo-dependent phosphatase-like protein [Chytridium lagenaria]
MFFCDSLERCFSNCDSPLALVEAAFEFFGKNKETRDPDFIIYTGDTSRHDRDLNRPRTTDDVLSDHRRIIEYFGKTYDLKRIKVFPTIGNNDVFGHSVQKYGPTPILSNLTEIWRPLGLNLDTDPNFQTGGWFIHHLNDKLSIISLNTLWFYIWNNFTTDCTTPTAPGNIMMDWLDVELKRLKSVNKRAYIIGHISPKDEMDKKAYFDACYDRYIRLVGTHSATIAAHFHGHINFDMLSYLSHDTSTDVYTLSAINSTFLPQYSNPLDPAVAATTSIVHVFTNSPSIIPLYNPSARVYTYEPSGTLLDYTQFYTDLVEDNERGVVAWETEYKATEVYGVKDLAMESLVGIVKGLYEFNSSTMEKYSKFFDVGALDKRR